MQNLLNNKWVLVIGSLLVGLVAGALIFGGGGEHEHAHGTGEKELAATAQTWTCAMHPQIRQPEPGKCPICGMDLTPLSDLSKDPLLLEMSETATQLAGIQTEVLELAEPDRTIFMQGKVEPDERNLSLITARFPGRIERLNIDFTGAEVRKGQVLATVYSPELITAQKELLEAAKYREINPELYRAAKTKLKLWDLSDARIEEIEKGGSPATTISITSPASGIVTRREVTTGAYVKEGTPLFEVLDLSRVWLVFDAYEQDLPWLKTGDEVSFTVQSLPGQEFISRITFIDPILDARTRTVRVRTEAANPGRKLKPGMFGSGSLQASLQLKGEQLTVPRSAVLWTGKRSVVWVKVPGAGAPVFQFREITLGPELGNRFLVESGLEAGEEVVSQGAFSVDAAAQLAGKRSMMNREEQLAASAPLTVPKEFRDALAKLLDGYFELKNELIDSDQQGAKAKLEGMKAALEAVEAVALDEEAASAWSEIGERVSSSLQKIPDSDDLAATRKAFAPLSNALSEAIRIFGVSRQVVYMDYCPMANGDEGAIWLSEFREIRNPYFGESMMKCGEVREVWKSQ